MISDQRAIAAAWQLSADGDQRLARASTAHVAACHDIDQALLHLLGERRQVVRWLRRPQPPLYHGRPLDIILATPAGAHQIRRLLLAELAARDPGDGIVAAALAR
ncbi:Protein of unknown function [Sphingomonas laterariae]|uniref:Antitoxin Xre/MbcA/ParS-like toxin-binding domain-containing protein n=1 Tax=Edaphosphingomonas laterariae TaxID=861865 RepID=A0A239I8Q9_9SPHN|nr:MbcA/ParS/Xre antitoxin family protein [Sphingomonas laterariae]SNS89990.1 Protein of unknown function [Sphingomonas laterariae]